MTPAEALDINRAIEINKRVRRNYVRSGVTGLTLLNESDAFINLSITREPHIGTPKIKKLFKDLRLWWVLTRWAFHDHAVPPGYELVSVDVPYVSDNGTPFLFRTEP